MGRQRRVGREHQGRPQAAGGALISASEISRLGYCEMEIYLDRQHGEAPTEAQTEARRRGTRAHELFLEESRPLAAASGKKGRCFIATLALGPGAQTQALRQFRDLYLRQSRWGRSFIHLYYRTSPKICQWLATRPRMLGLVRIALKPMAQLAARLVRRKVEQEVEHAH